MSNLSKARALITEVIRYTKEEYPSHLAPAIMSSLNDALVLLSGVKAEHKKAIRLERETIRKLVFQASVKPKEIYK